MQGVKIQNTVDSNVNRQKDSGGENLSNGVRNSLEDEFKNSVTYNVASEVGRNIGRAAAGVSRSVADIVENAVRGDGYTSDAPTVNYQSSSYQSNSSQRNSSQRNSSQSNSYRSNSYQNNSSQSYTNRSSSYGGESGYRENTYQRNSYQSNSNSYQNNSYQNDVKRNVNPYRVTKKQPENQPDRNNGPVNSSGNSDKKEKESKGAARFWLAGSLMLLYAVGFPFHGAVGIGIAVAAGVLGYNLGKIFTKWNSNRLSVKLAEEKKRLA